MFEKFSSLNEIHDEVDSKRFDEYELHAYDEGMIDLVEDCFLKMQVLQRIVLEYDVFSDTLHGIELLRVFVLDEINFSESALSNNINHLEVIEAKVDLTGSLSPVECLGLRISWLRHDLI
jgi:hypothetical protein